MFVLAHDTPGLLAIGTLFGFLLGVSIGAAMILAARTRK